MQKILFFNKILLCQSFTYIYFLIKNLGQIKKIKRGDKKGEKYDREMIILNLNLTINKGNL